MKITLKQNGNIEVKVGAFCPHIVGTWKYVDVWAINGGRHDKSGNKLVRGYWEACLKKGGDLMAYTRRELAEQIRAKAL